MLCFYSNLWFMFCYEMVDYSMSNHKFPGACDDYGRYERKKTFLLIFIPLKPSTHTPNALSLTPNVLTHGVKLFKNLALSLALSIFFSYQRVP